MFPLCKILCFKRIWILFFSACFFHFTFLMHFTAEIILHKLNPSSINWRIKNNEIEMNQINQTSLFFRSFLSSDINFHLCNCCCVMTVIRSQKEHTSKFLNYYSLQSTACNFLNGTIFCEYLKFLYKPVLHVIEHESLRLLRTIE